jgi:hypothetical protein
MRSDYLGNEEALDRLHEALQRQNQYAAKLLLYRCAESIRDGRPLPTSIRGPIAEILEEVAAGGDPRNGLLPLTRGKGAPGEKDKLHLAGISRAMQLALLHAIAVKAGIPDKKAISVLAEALHGGSRKRFNNAIEMWKADWQEYMGALTDLSREALRDALGNCDGAEVDNLRRVRALGGSPHQEEIAQILIEIDGCN